MKDTQPEGNVSTLGEPDFRADARNLHPPPCQTGSVALEQETKQPRQHAEAGSVVSDVRSGMVVLALPACLRVQWCSQPRVKLSLAPASYCSPHLRQP